MWTFWWIKKRNIKKISNLIPLILIPRSTINAYMQIRKHNCTNSCTIVKCILFIYLKSSMFKLIAVKGKKCKLFASCHMPK
jgi:hypothetical protein